MTSLCHAGARGLPPTPYLKVSATSVDGWKIGGMLFIGGVDARKKALAVADAVRPYDIGIHEYIAYGSASDSCTQSQNTVHARYVWSWKMASSTWTLIRNY